MPTPIEKLAPTTILRNNPGMFRDCWVEDDKEGSGGKVVSIRQIRFNADGGAGETKVIRLVGDEINILLQVLSQMR